MEIVINGERRECKEEIKLLELLEDLGLQDKVMAAAVNMNIVKQDEWADYVLQEGDKLELLDFVGGG